MLQKEKLEQPLEVETDVPEEIKTYRIHKLLPVSYTHLKEPKPERVRSGVMDRNK